VTDEPRTLDTKLLGAAGRGDRRAAEEILPLVYDELRKLARARLRKVPPGNTLQPTALVHEAYMRLVRGEDRGWDSRGHFFAAAAEAMRQILVDQARRKSRVKRGGDRKRLDADEIDLPIEGPGEDVLALHDALSRLEVEDERKAKVVKLRYFVGLQREEVAEVLGVSLRTADRDWRYSAAFLRRAMAEGDTAP
jgi:RNA polymerase sigma factor (TIGR02999 family)